MAKILRQIRKVSNGGMAAGLFALLASIPVQAQGVAFIGDYEAASPAAEDAGPTLPALRGRLLSPQRAGSGQMNMRQTVPQQEPPMMSREMLATPVDDDQPESKPGLLQKIPRFSMSSIFGESSSDETANAPRQATYNGPRRMQRSLAPNSADMRPAAYQEPPASEAKPSRFSLRRLFGDDAAPTAPTTSQPQPEVQPQPKQNAAPLFAPQQPVQQTDQAADPFDNNVTPAGYTSRGDLGSQLRPSGNRPGSLFGSVPNNASQANRGARTNANSARNAFNRGPETMQRLAQSGQANSGAAPTSQPIFVSDGPSSQGPNPPSEMPVPISASPSQRPLAMTVSPEMPEPIRQQPVQRTQSNMPRAENPPQIVENRAAVKIAQPLAVRNPVPPRVETAPAAPAAPPSERVVQLLAEANSFAQSAETEEQFTQVVQMCRHALAIDSSPQAVQYSKNLSAWALNRRGELRADAGREREAMLDFDDAIHTSPELWRAVHNRGVMLAQQGQFAAAFDEFNRTIELNPKFAKAYSNRAALYTQAGDLAAALEDYHRAISLDPDLAVAHKGRGRVCHMVGNFEEALQHYDAAVLLASGDAHIALGRADLLTDMSRYAAAIEGYYQTIELDPTNAAAYRSLAWLQATCPDETFRDPQQALANAEQALRHAGQEDDLTLDTLAAAQANAGDFAAAQATQARAIELASAGDRELYQERLTLYESNRPFRTAPPQPIRQATYRR